MATRSTIAIRIDRTTIQSIYCHWDGYPNHNGKILLEHYTDPKKIQKLIALGNLSTLAKNIGTKHEFERGALDECTAYGRDREQPGQEPMTHDSIKEWKEVRQNWGCEYGYLYYPETGKWKTFSL